jgi:hypothetical protein
MGQDAEGSKANPPNARRADCAPARHHGKTACKILQPARKALRLRRLCKKNIISAWIGYRWALWTCILESRHRDVRSALLNRLPRLKCGNLSGCSACCRKATVHCCPPKCVNSWTSDHSTRVIETKPPGSLGGFSLRYWHRPPRVLRPAFRVSTMMSFTTCRRYNRNALPEAEIAP